VTSTDPTPVPTVRWTEHGPEPLETGSAASRMFGVVDESENVTPAPVPTPEPVPADLESIKARLAAKGLVRDQPAIRIREVAGDAPRPVVAFEPEPVLTNGNRITDDDLGDPEELEPEQPGSTTTVRCPSCRTPQAVPDAATGYKCRSCAKVWRWATCGTCFDLGLTIARQESWRCSCGGYTRSWWRTPTRAAEHRRVAEARATDAADRRRRQAYDKARRRRWKLIALGAVAILATAGVAIRVSSNSTPVTARGANGRVCDAFADLQRGINGRVPAAEIRSAADSLAAESVGAVDRIRIPAQQLAGSGQPGDKPFDDAAAALGNACTPTA
jgi:ribosomal protein S27E